VFAWGPATVVDCRGSPQPETKPISNKAALFAQDTPDLDGESRDTFFVAGCAYQVPILWLFCFDTDSLTLHRVENDEGESALIPDLVSSMASVRQRLAKRDELARAHFPKHTAVWEEWRQAVESVEMPYLKTGLVEIWCLYQDAEGLRRELAGALAWLGGGPKSGFNDLLSLAGLETYNARTRDFTFDPKRDCAERYLYGWLEMAEF
jgi:hypothetical protein